MLYKFQNFINERKITLQHDTSKFKLQIIVKLKFSIKESNIQIFKILHSLKLR